MKANMGTLDRTLRILIAVVIAILYSTKVINGTPGAILLILAAILFFTGFMGYCLLYIPFKISTARQKEEKLTK